MSGCVGGGGGRICQVVCRQPHVVRLLWPASSSRDEFVEICRGRQRFRPGSSGDVVTRGNSPSHIAFRFEVGREPPSYTSPAATLAG